MIIASIYNEILLKAARIPFRSTKRRMEGTSVKVADLKEAYPSSDSLVIVNVLGQGEEVVARAWCAERATHGVIRRDGECCFACAVGVTAGRTGFRVRRIEIRSLQTEPAKRISTNLLLRQMPWLFTAVSGESRVTYYGRAFLARALWHLYKWLSSKLCKIFLTFLHSLSCLTFGREIAPIYHLYNVLQPDFFE